MKDSELARLEELEKLPCDADEEFVVAFRAAAPTLFAEIRRLKKENERLRSFLRRIDEACLCERFTTKGFDYSEEHPEMGRPGIGKRWLTPKILVGEALRLLDKKAGDDEREA